MDRKDSAKVNRDVVLIKAIAALSSAEALQLATLLKLNEDKPEEWPSQPLPFPALGSKYAV